MRNCKKKPTTIPISTNISLKAPSVPETSKGTTSLMIKGIIELYSPAQMPWTILQNTRRLKLGIKMKKLIAIAIIVVIMTHCLEYINSYLLENFWRRG